MASIYVHIPFCKTRCHYCDFYKSTLFSLKKEFFTALEKEINFRKNEISEVVESIYFGGGTPSLLSPTEVEQILTFLFTIFDIDNKAEITLESNPDDLTPDYLKGLRNTRINRLSIGIQSFHDEDLSMMNRRHDSKQAVECVKNAQDSGFENISVDLLYGLPRQNIEKWEENLHQAISLNVSHLSAYHLTYHEGTVLNKYIEEGKIAELSEDTSLEQFRLLISMMEVSGYEHYEISNFARDGLYSRHNCSYWNGDKYLGFGPAAHSYDGKTRRWNVSNLETYLFALDNGDKWWQVETLSLEDRYNDYIITALRTKWGISQTFLESNFEEKIVQYFLKQVQSYLQSGHLYIVDGVFKLSENGVFISDKIMESLFYLT